MGNWVRGIATFLIVHGALDLAAGVLCTMGIFAASSAGSGERAEPWSPAILAVIALVLLAFGALRIWAGVRNRRYRSRALGVVAMSVGMLDPLVWSCTLVFLAMSVLGLVAYLGQEGTKAFEWGESGCSVADVQRALRELRGGAPAGSHSSRGLVIALSALIGFAILIALVGVMTALAIYGARKYLANAKRSEAQTVAAELARGIARCATQHGKLPPTSAAVPADFAHLRGVKYQSAAGDWADEAFVCAGFSLADPQYFQYQWVKQSDSNGVVRAVADLDGDGQPDGEHRVEVVCDHGQCSLRAASPAGTAL